MKIKRYVKKGAKNAWKAVKKYTGDRYGRGWKQISTKGIPQMIKDINQLKAVINSEKLRYTIASSSTTPNNVAQINGNSAGHHTFDVTPQPTQGDGYNNRTGASIKIHSSNFQFLFTEQTNTMSDLRLKIVLFEVKGNSTTAATAVSEMFLANPFTGIIDYSSARNPDYFKDYRVLKTKFVKIPMNPASMTGQFAVKPIRFGMKYKNRHVRWDKNTSVITSGQMFCVIFCDVGNFGAAPTIAPYTSATIPIQSTLTGAQLMYNIDHYYYDN